MTVENIKPEQAQPKLLAPMELDFLLRAYTTPLSEDSYVVVDGVLNDTRLKFMQHLGQHGLISVDATGWVRATEKGAVFIHHLMNQPFPTQKWVIE